MAAALEQGSALVHRVVLPSRIDAACAVAVAQAANEPLPRGAGPWVCEIDASALQAFDSSAVAVLLGLAREATKRGASMRLSGLSPRLADLMALYGVAEILVGMAPAAPAAHALS